MCAIQNELTSNILVSISSVVFLAIEISNRKLALKAMFSGKLKKQRIKTKNPAGARFCG